MIFFQDAAAAEAVDATAEVVKEGAFTFTDLINDPAGTLPKLTDAAVNAAPKLLIAILILIIGFWIAKRVAKFINGMLGKTLDVSLAKFVGSIVSLLLKVVVLMVAASVLGINTTSIVAIFAALMVGVGMALNGTLGQLASGIMLMIFKPIRVGDLVEVGGGHLGTVEAINAFNTTLETLDNKRIIVANSNVTGNTITNISGQGTVGVELDFRIPYDVDIDKAREVILGVGKNNPHVIHDTSVAPAHGVVVSNLKDGYVTLSTRPFVKSENYWDAYFGLQEQGKKALDAAGIAMPMPNTTVHLNKMN